MIRKLLISTIATFIFLFIVSPFVSAQTVYTFTTCGATGQIGPTQAQANTTYTATTLAGSVTVTGGIQYWTVPTTGNYKIAAFGAQGGGANGGLGASMEGEFFLTQNQVLRILVGQQGLTQSAQVNSVGGGGGSFVVKSPATTTGDILVIAGGGGGSASNSYATRHANTGTSGNNGHVDAGVSNPDGAGGSNGSGGNKSVIGCSLDRGAGGGGFLTDGGSVCQTVGIANGGSSFLNGGQGGSITGTAGIQGSFGGGGATWQTGFRGSGGGGGYSGGGAGQINSDSPNHAGGGGGSYNAGTNQVNLASVQTGNGLVVITNLSRPLNNAGVTDIISPVDNCDGLVQNVQVKIRNLGANQISSLEVHWTINSISQTVYNYSGLLDTVNGFGSDSAIVNLGTISLTAGVSDEVVAWTEMPNNMVDSSKADDTSKVSVQGFDFPIVSMIVIPRNNLCFNAPYEFRANTTAQDSIMYQWKVNTVNSGPLTSNNKFNPSLMNGDSVNVELVTVYCDTASYSVESNYITMHLNPVPKLINGSTATDTVLENTSKNYLVPVVSGSVFTWSAIGGTIGSPVGNAVQVDWGTAMDTAKIMATEKDAGNCSYTNVRNVVIISIVGVKDENNLIGIGYAYPNPANTSVTIPLVIDGNWDIDLSLYDMTGKKVKAIFNGAVSGNRDITFTVDDLQNGMYFYKVSTSDGFESVKKLTIKH